MIRVPAFPKHLKPVCIHRDQAILTSPEGDTLVTGPWCGELAARVDGRTTRFELVTTLGTPADRLQILDTILRLHEGGLLVDAAPHPLDPSVLDFSPAPADDSRLLRLADPPGAIVPYLQRRDTADDFLHVVWAPQRMPAACERRSSDETRVAVGTGLTEREASIACIGEAVERLSVCFDGTERILRGRASELDAPAVLASSLLLISDVQYGTRETFNSSGGGEMWLPEPPDESRATDWTPVWSLTRGERRYVPAAYCFLRYPSESPESFSGDSNGCAAGRSLEDSIIRAFCELVERDSLALWWYNRTPRPAFDAMDVGGDLAAHIRGRFAETGRTLHLLDLTSDLGIPVVAAISARLDGSGVAFGFGANLRVRAAARRALLEMQQVLGALASPNRGAWLDRWAAEVNLARERWLAPEPGQVSKGGDAATEGAGDLAHCVEAARRRGLEVLAANVTRPGIEVPVARVIVPGLRPAAPRFAAGRLYDVPVALGWQKAPLPERELNPFPFFL